MASLSYLAAACNRFSHAADISPSSSLIAFGSSTLIVLWKLDSNDAGISETLHVRQGSITCVKFLTDEILSTANDMGMLICWKKQLTQWRASLTVQAHSHSISTLSVQDHQLVTGSSDSLIKVWRFVEGSLKDDIVHVQTIDLLGKYPLSSALAYLPQSNVPLLAVGGTDKRIHLWLSLKNEFVHSATLPGHEDWIRSLAFKCPEKENDPLILASASQDATVRLWNIELISTRSNLTLGAPAEFNELVEDFELLENGGRQLSLKHHILTLKDETESQHFSVTFDALLVGHEAAVTSISWRRDIASMPTLMSTSTDSSVILWSPATVLNPSGDGSTIWINRQRFGDVGGQRLGGFVGGLWGDNGNAVLAWGWAGGWRRWTVEVDIAQNGFTLANENWNEAGAISGHNGAVKGLDWSPDGNYIISAGLDQTTRIHGPLRIGDGNQTNWHEIARPQVHGYHLLNVVFINSLKFASIADEKVIRIFEAPRGFVELSERLGVGQFSEEEHKRPAAANVPPLGLSNKATNEGTEDLIDTSRRPFEGELSSLTLWPEIEKVFGHGYESVTLGISNSRNLLAAACKASSADHAVVHVFDTGTYKLIGSPLRGHVLTVTRIAFSPDDKYILTVSRDRSWRLFEMQEGDYKHVAFDKSHSRIIWDCGWSVEGDVFATASRDKTVKIWQHIKNNWKAVHTILTNQPATALAFSPTRGDRRRLAVGFEDGQIITYSGTSLVDWRQDEAINPNFAHADHIHRMSWRPSSSGFQELATCSEDGTLRVLRFNF